VLYVIGQIYTFITHASVDFFALQSNVTSDTMDYIAISPVYRSAIQRRFPADLKRDRLAVSNHVLYVIGEHNSNEFFMSIKIFRWFTTFVHLALFDYPCFI